jgi:hypothetical protein
VVRDAVISHPLIHEPGIFRGMPEEEYHRALALSASGIKWLRVSSLDWWARSVLSPDYVDEETEAKRIGKAFHARIVEGRDVFNDRYAAALDPADYPDALRTNEQLRQAIIDAGGTAKAAARKSDLIDTLRLHMPGAVVWDSIVDAHRIRSGDRILLPADLIRRIEIAAGYIEKHPDLGRAFTGGYPEVSVFWHDPETGIPCKARFDYLKAAAIVDLKSFENVFGVPVDQAVTRAIANYRYPIQAAWYLDAMRHHEPDVERRFLFVFQQKGVAPLARGYLLPQMALEAARDQIRDAKELWRRCWDSFGPDTPWVDVADIREIDLTEFPPWVLT